MSLQSSGLFFLRSLHKLGNFIVEATALVGRVGGLERSTNCIKTLNNAVLWVCPLCREAQAVPNESKCPFSVFLCFQEVLGIGSRRLVDFVIPSKEPYDEMGQDLQLV